MMFEESRWLFCILGSKKHDVRVSQCTTRLLALVLFWFILLRKPQLKGCVRAEYGVAL